MTSSKVKIRHQHCEKCSNSLPWLEAEGYTATELTIRNDQVGDAETIKFDMKILFGEDEVPEEELDKLDMATHICIL